MRECKTTQNVARSFGTACLTASFFMSQAELQRRRRWFPVRLFLDHPPRRPLWFHMLEVVGMMGVPVVGLWAWFFTVRFRARRALKGLGGGTLTPATTAMTGAAPGGSGPSMALAPEAGTAFSMPHATPSVAAPAPPSSSAGQQGKQPAELH